MTVLSPFEARLFQGRLISLTIPTASYLVGEWIGRSLAKQRDALFVAAGAPNFAISLIWGLSHFLIGARKEALEALQRGRTEELQSMLPIIALITLLAAIIPMLAGAYRGAKYKPFYDLAFISKRLSRQSREEIENYVRRFRYEYVNTAEPRPS
jgi:hypothetical protein